MLALIIGSREGEAAPYCERFSYRGTTVVLSIPQNYYARPRSADSMISLQLRYSDLTAAKSLDHHGDPGELADPSWSVDASRYNALLQVERHDISPPSTVEDFKQSYPNLREVDTDWPDWRRLEQCPEGCQQVFYVSDLWRAAGVSYVLCYEVPGRDPLVLGCEAHDFVEHLHVVYLFPAVKKHHFAAFREKITKFLQQRAADADTACRT
jgi:hypothetical protein